MKDIGILIRELRLEKGYPLRKVAAFLDIDQAILSKIERGQRKLSREQVIKLAGFFNYSEKEMVILYLSDRLLSEVGDDEYAHEALKVAEKKIEYKLFMSIDRKSITTIIVKILQQFSKIKQAWIYGSFARKDDTPGSDIDIAVQTDKGFSYFDLAEIQFKLESELKRKIDIGFIDSFKPNILKNVKPDLKLIYERS